MCIQVCFKSCITFLTYQLFSYQVKCFVTLISLCFPLSVWCLHECQPSVSSLSVSHCLSFNLQEEKGISCGLVDLDFLKCSVGFPFMRAQTKVVELNSRTRSIFDTSQVSGENDTLQFLVLAKRYNICMHKV